MSEKFNDEEFKWWIGSESNNEFLKWWYDNDQFEGKYQELAGHAAGAAWFQQQKKIESIELMVEEKDKKSIGLHEEICRLKQEMYERLKEKSDHEFSLRLIIEGKDREIERLKDSSANPVSSHERTIKNLEDVVKAADAMENELDNIVKYFKFEGSTCGHNIRNLCMSYRSAKRWCK